MLVELISVPVQMSTSKVVQGIGNVNPLIAIAAQTIQTVRVE